MKDYTIVGYYEDNSEVWVGHYQGSDVTDAISQVKGTISEDTHNNLMILSVFEGKHVDLNECDTISCLADWPEREES